MKALSLTQPWATLVAIGAKKYETRSWSTKYRGPLYIHAAKRFPVSMEMLALYHEPFKSALGGLALRLPRGAIIAVADLTGCFKTPPDGWPMHPHGGFGDGLPQSPQERAFGDYSPGRYAWHLENVRALPEPIPWKGQLGLFNMPDLKAVSP